MKSQKLLFAIHPILNDLKINEDGTEMYWMGNKLEIKTTYPKGRIPFRYVQFKSRTHKIPKLVCEAWNGVRDDMDLVVQHKGKMNNDHFTNLYWGKRGLNPNASRGKLSKINKKDIPFILARIKNDETLVSIAIDYNTSAMSIYRLKKRYA